MKAKRVRYRGETVSLWNTSASGPPSPEQIAKSVDEAHAALNRYAAKDTTP